jgi:putative nucleotidyltransferase with HDIG domain
VFSAGLLHDIGKLIMHIYIPDDFAAVARVAADNKIDSLRAEELTLDYTHCDLGAMFAQRWNLPKVIEQAIQYHHSPTNADEGRNNVLLVSLANNIALKAFGVDEENEKELVGVFNEAKENLGMSPHDVMQSISLLREEYAKAETFVRMAKSG